MLQNYVQKKNSGIQEIGDIEQIKETQDKTR